MNARKIPRALLQENFARSGWKEFLRTIAAENTPQNLPPYTMTTIYAALGEKDKAFAGLEKAYENREFYPVLLKVDPRLDPLRDDSRFRDLLRRVGFPQ